MPGRMAEAGVSPALSRNCDLRVDRDLSLAQEARSTASTPLFTTSWKGVGEYAMRGCPLPLWVRGFLLCKVKLCDVLLPNFCLYGLQPTQGLRLLSQLW